MSSKKTPSENAARNMEKKARTKERKAMEHLEGSEEKAQYLRERDECNDKAAEMRRNIAMNAKNNGMKEMKKIAEASKSEDQLLNEAMRQARRERNEAEKLLKEEEIKEDEKKGRRAAAIATREEKKKEKEEAKSEFNRVMGEAEKEEKVEKDAFSKDYREKHPEATNSEIQKEFVRKQKLDNRKENIVGFFVQNMAEITGEEPKEVYERFKEFSGEFMERPENKRKMDKMVSSESEDVVQSLEEEVKAQLTEANCKKQFVEQVVKMTGENEEEIEKEYDEDYKKFTAFAEEEGYTRQRAVDKYVDISNKKLQAAHLRYMVVTNLMKDKGMNVDEANDEFDKMMNVMSQEQSDDPEPEENMCLPCK
jgi:colicin import membrane protein